jgi:hypothetical protein
VADASAGGSGHPFPKFGTGLSQTEITRQCSLIGWKLTYIYPQTNCPNLFKEITVTAASSSTIKFVIVIGNPKFVRNFKLGAASPATQKLSELRHDICLVYFKIIVTKILGRVHA